LLLIRIKNKELLNQTESIYKRKLNSKLSKIIKVISRINETDANNTKEELKMKKMKKQKRNEIKSIEKRSNMNEKENLL